MYVKLTTLLKKITKRFIKHDIIINNFIGLFIMNKYHDEFHNLLASNNINILKTINKYKKHIEKIEQFGAANVGIVFFVIIFTASALLFFDIMELGFEWIFITLGISIPTSLILAYLNIFKIKYKIKDSELYSEFLSFKNIFSDSDNQYLAYSYFSAYSLSEKSEIYALRLRDLKISIQHQSLDDLVLNIFSLLKIIEEDNNTFNVKLKEYQQRNFN